MALLSRETIAAKSRSHKTELTICSSNPQPVSRNQQPASRTSHLKQMTIDE
jgi:hypothetical protein